MLTIGTIAILVLIAILAIGLHLMEIRYDENKAKQAKLKQRANEAIEIQKEVDTRKIESFVLDELNKQELRGVSAWLDRMQRGE